MWHVKRAWVKNLRQKVRGKGGHFKMMLAQLTEILEATELSAAEAAMQKFLEDWVRAGRSLLPSLHAVRAALNTTNARACRGAGDMPRIGGGVCALRSARARVRAFVRACAVCASYVRACVQ